MAVTRTLSGWTFGRELAGDASAQDDIARPEQVAQHQQRPGGLPNRRK